MASEPRYALTLIGITAAAAAAVIIACETDTPPVGRDDGQPWGEKRHDEGRGRLPAARGRVGGCDTSLGVGAGGPDGTAHRHAEGCWRDPALGSNGDVVELQHRGRHGQ